MSRWGLGVQLRAGVGGPLSQQRRNERRSRLATTPRSPSSGGVGALVGAETVTMGSSPGSDNHEPVEPLRWHSHTTAALPSLVVPTLRATPWTATPTACQVGGAMNPLNTVAG